MGQDSQPISTSVFSIDVSADSKSGGNRPATRDGQIVDLLQQILESQERQNDLLQEMAESMNASQRQRAAELGKWKQSNPQLSDRCRRAAEILSEVQTEFLESLTNEVDFHSESLMEGDFMLNEFVDKFGPRMAHLNGVLQVLSQLSSLPKSFTDDE